MDRFEHGKPDLFASDTPCFIDFMLILVTWHGTGLLMRIFRVPILIDQTLRVQWVLQLVQFDKFDSCCKAYLSKY
jgi:hypothetical protein